MPATEVLGSGDTARAAEILRRGGLVALPTETVYGLAGDATNGTAVASIFAAKGRPQFNPLIAHVADLAMAETIGAFSTDARALAAAFWPGALTLVVPLRDDSGLSPLVTAGGARVALRVPDHPVAQAVLAELGRPLAAPSANPSGRVSPTRADHVRDGLDGRIDAILDGGPCPVGVESTIVGFGDGAPTLLRPGGLPREALEEALGAPLASPVAHNPSQPAAPGMLSSHYAPGASVRLNATQAAAGEVLIGFGSIAGDLTLSAAGDLTEAAARLFQVLREADQRSSAIAVAPIPDHGLGLAINDRLSRAAAPRPPE